MKSSLRALALSIVVSLSMACAAVTNPLVLPGSRPTPTTASAPGLAATEVETTGLPQLATELAGTLEAPTESVGTPEPPAEATPEGQGSISAIGTAMAATLEAATRGTLVAPPIAGTPGSSSLPNADIAIRVTDSLNILLGEQPGAQTLPSYHLEMKQLSPVMSNGTVAQSQETVSADVQGVNVHFTDTTIAPGGQPKVSEAYIIGDKNYVVKDGQVSPDLGMTSVAWSTWPINAEMVLGLGSLKAAASGNETIESRSADVYTLSGTSSDDPTGLLAASGMPVTNVKGQVWVDHATGVLLKAVLDYTAQASGGASSKDAGPGRLEITVTQVGAVTVKDPGQ